VCVGSFEATKTFKRDRLPSASALAGARESIIAWWQDAWLNDSALRTRFERETMAALPVGSVASTDDVFAALEWRRLRLRQDQQVQGWAGADRLGRQPHPDDLLRRTRRRRSQ
jgi:hypothetical protein